MNVLIYTFHVNYCQRFLWFVRLLGDGSSWTKVCQRLA